MITEATCPTCGSEGAYVGFSTIECPNPPCRHFNHKMGREARMRGEFPGGQIVTEPELFEHFRDAWNAIDDLSYQSIDDVKFVFYPDAKQDDGVTHLDAHVTRGGSEQNFEWRFGVGEWVDIDE